MIKSKAKRRHYPMSLISLGKKHLVMEYYLTNNENSTILISKLFGVSVYNVNRIIDDYYKDKKAINLDVEFEIIKAS